MLTPSVRHALSTFAEQLAARFGERVRTLTLFGSYARGEAREDSDVDVLVVIDGLEGAERRVVLDLAGDIFAQTDLLLSPTVYDAETWQLHTAQERPLAASIAREGVAL